MMGKICAFFGHRELWSDLSEPLEQAARMAIIEYDVCTFWVGGYGSFDSCACGMIRRLKKEYPHISLHLILAYLPARKDPLTDSYDGTIYPERLETVPQRFAISKRNRWMVNNADIVIAYVNHSYGGAYAAYRSARKKGKLMVNLGRLDA